VATVFQRKGKTTYTASIKVWDAGKQDWAWQQRPTHLQDEKAALAVAVALENASRNAKAGHMTQEKAEALVQSIMQLAGLNISFKKSVTVTYGNAFIEHRTEAAGDEEAPVDEDTRRRYVAHWSRFKKWAGERINCTLEEWKPEDFREYYKDLRSELWITTANGHLNTLSMMFHQAVKEGVLRSNPVALVKKLSDDPVEKMVFTRDEVAKLLRAMRRARRDWTLLSLLGWHTGHRIDDMLKITTSSIEKRPVVGHVIRFQPGKKRSRGGREVVLPIPSYVSKMMKGVGDFTSIRKADNRNGRISNDFVEWLKKAGINPLPVQRGKRAVNLKSYHSFRHSMSSRLAAAGVDSTTARLVTDHDDEKVHRAYVHAEITALAEALKKARRR
jgi:site-specific recombinase XerD